MHDTHSVAPTAACGRPVVPDGLPACVRARHPPDADRPAVGASGIAVVFDVLYFLTDNSNFSIAAGFAIGAGVIGGLLAAAFGLIDWLAIPNGTRAKRIGMLHGVGNVVVVALFAGSWVLRCQADSWDTTAAEFILALVGLALAGATGWLGGELVERLGVGVDAAAGLDARSSLSHHERSARSPRPA